MDEKALDRAARKILGWMLRNNEDWMCRIATQFEEIASATGLPLEEVRVILSPFIKDTWHEAG